MWEHVVGPPDSRLPGIVRPYTGYRELGAPVVHREVPTVFLPLIISLGEPFAVRFPHHSEAEDVPAAGFAAGLSDGPALVRSTGAAECIQVDLTPPVARRVLGLPLSELLNRVVDLDDLLGPDARRLREALAGTPGWPARFALVDAFLLRRLEGGRPVSRQVEWAWQRLAESGGRLRVDALAAEVGWSRKHLATRFHDAIGLAPKTAARVLRFERTMARLRAADGLGWAAIAYDCGYADQAHLIRDVRAFSGTTPVELAGRLQANGALHEP